MKRKIMICVFCVLMMIALAGCVFLQVSETIPTTGSGDPSVVLAESMERYSQIVSGELPEDFCLTIYYVNPEIDTRIAWDAEDLMRAGNVKKIEVSLNELSLHINVLRAMESTVLQPAEDAYVNARVYYYFEAGDAGKVLEVIICERYCEAFVNGIRVDHSKILYELIMPFLEEEDFLELGLPLDGNIPE